MFLIKCSIRFINAKNYENIPKSVKVMYSRPRLFFSAHGIQFFNRTQIGNPVLIGV